MWDTIWQFNTARFTVLLQVAPEVMDPADSFEEDDPTIEAIYDDRCHWFAARVVVLNDETGLKIGSDYLGGCAYYTPEKFYTNHRDSDPMNRNCSLMRAARGSNVVICHYFPDMVRCAIADARTNMEKLRL